jgi:hypothetical protein
LLVSAFHNHTVVTAVLSLSALATVIGDTLPLPNKFQPASTLMVVVWVRALPQATLNESKVKIFDARIFMIGQPMVM